jgi:hypothetical protein
MLAKKLMILIAITAVAVTSMACGFTINVPITADIKTGPTVTEDILVSDPDPDAESVDVSISFGAGDLTINPGAEALIVGTAIYNVEDFRPEIKTEDNWVELSTGSLEIEGIPRFDDRMENTWDLMLSDRPIDLRIMAGAYASTLELGGLSLTGLRITDGAADVHVNFAEMNQETMDLFRYETGASSVVLSNLGNANFRSLIFKGGAGSYELDFSGDLQDDATVSIEAGLSNLTVRVPDDLNVRVRIESGLANISTHGSWGQSGGAYTSAGNGPELTINITVAAGNLVLETE